MGKGIAFQFKKAFPDDYDAYRGEVQPGKVFVYRLHKSTGQILNFPTIS